MAGHQGWVAHPTKARTVRRPCSCERATAAVPLVRVSDTSKRGLLPATAAPSAVVTCHSSRRVRPRPQGTSRCRTGKAAATAMVLCNLFGGSSSFRVGATPPAFLSATAGIESGGALSADHAWRRSGAACGCAPNKSFTITTTSRRSVTSSPGESGTAVRASSSRRRCRQRLHRDRSAVFSMRLLVVDGNNNEEGTSPRQEEESSSRALPQRSAGALGPAARGATSRLELLRQTSAAAALVGAATAGLLLPTRRVGASTTDSSRTPVAKMAAAASERMVWVNEDSGTVSSRLSQTDETYGQGFVAYLARFLLNYDEGCREYFKGKLDCTLPRRDGSHVWEEFRGFVAAVGLGLHEFQGSKGARELLESLSRKYVSDGAPQQLAMLFSLLPPDIQPVPDIKSLLSFPTEGASGFRAVRSSDFDKDLDFKSIFGKSPSALLPEELRPRYDEGVGAFFVPGVPRQAEMAFGARGPFPTSKERILTAVDFAVFAACGAVGCTSTHLSVIPLDVVKTRLQTDPGRYSGLAGGVTTIAKEEGWMMLMQGFGPTLAGYLWYGITVYPGYELFKRLFMQLVGPLNAALFRVPLVLAAGAAATSIACIGVCPAEAVRIRQVADPAVGSMPSAIKQIVAESGWGKLYEGLPSILFRQISFGMMKFLVFDFFTDFAYDLVPYLADQKSTQLAVSLTSGLVAGVCAAIVSQPADTVLSTMSRSPDRLSIPNTIRTIVDERGPGGLFLGLPSRIVWSGAIISGQFLLYDLCKTALHVSVDDLRVFLDVVASAGL
ncbi:unnamed protein product [Ectocarpus sp. CCAP 1310/34]|nr:unnamed protein product [Ectocarpus sp. CCAP 1310/34]